MTGFKAIRTNDIVWHQGQKHVVIHVDVRSDDVQLQLQPVVPVIKTVSYKDVGLTRPVASQPDIPAIKPSPNARKAWLYGVQQAQNSLKPKRGRKSKKSTDAVSRNPYDKVEIIAQVKNIMVGQLKETGWRYIDQGIVDAVTEKVAAAQGYLVEKCRQTGVKTADVSDWRWIASVVNHMANQYNQMFDTDHQIHPRK